MEQVTQVQAEWVVLAIQAAGRLAHPVGMARAAYLPGQVEEPDAVVDTVAAAHSRVDLAPEAVPGAVADTVVANVKQVDWRPVMLDCDHNVYNSQLDLN
jgi:hypothetical protein